MAAGRAGETAGSNKVSFTKASAQRIADVVRKVEQGNRDAIPYYGAPRIDGSNGIAVKRGSFTGDWDIDSVRVIEYCKGTTTATAEVTNLTCDFWAGDGTATTEGYVLFTKTCQGTNAAIELKMDQCRNIGGSIKSIAGFAAEEIQILGHDDGGCLKWYSIVTCTTATSS